MNNIIKVIIIMMVLFTTNSNADMYPTLATDIIKETEFYYDGVSIKTRPIYSDLHTKWEKILPDNKKVDSFDQTTWDSYKDVIYGDTVPYDPKGKLVTEYKSRYGGVTRTYKKGNTYTTINSDGSSSTYTTYDY